MEYNLYSSEQFHELLENNSQRYLDELIDTSIPSSYIFYQSYDDMRCHRLERVDDPDPGEIVYAFVFNSESLQYVLQNYQVIYLLTHDIPLSQVMESVKNSSVEHLHIQGGLTDVSQITLPTLTHFSIRGHDVSIQADSSRDTLEYLNIDQVDMKVRFPYLRYLRSSSGYHGLTRLEYLSVPSVDDISYLTNLHTLKIQVCDQLLDIPPNLRHLEIEKYHGEVMKISMSNLIVFDVHLTKCSEIQLNDTQELTHLGLTFDQNPLYSHIDWTDMKSLRRLIIQFDLDTITSLSDHEELDILLVNLNIEDFMRHHELLSEHRIYCDLKRIEQDPTHLICDDDQIMRVLREPIIKYYMRDVERLMT